MSFPPILIFLAGLVIIIIGAELVLRGASRFAALIGLKPIIIGLTIVSIGTSMPELAVGITAVSEGRSALAVGNIAGTNIVNILLILGLSAAIRRLPLELMSIKLDVPVMIASAVVLMIMAWNGELSRLEGYILFAGAIVYTVALIRLSKRESSEIRTEYEEEYGKDVLFKKKPGASLAVLNIAILIVGIGLTILGAEWLVAGAVVIAETFGVSDAVIGLTIIAIGTSAPELVTTIVATIKDDREVAIGNLIGSSICNILVILGITCIVAPNGVDVSNEILWFDLPLAAGVAIVCYPVFRSDKMVSRTEGIVFVSLYVVYLTTLLIFRT
jgi:cation:H+ antiporter